ncbi:cytoplasmic protein, partial [Bacillus paranthracis]|nr:cytoplasmic protein [Bacillus paranthracis]
LIGKPEYSVQELEVLIEELLQLVEHHAPELHIAEQRKRIQYAK